MALQNETLNPSEEIITKHTSFEEYIQKNQKLTLALETAKLAHLGQTRASGEPFVDHPVAVAGIMYDEWGLANENFLVAALLHDVVEDTEIRSIEIADKFGVEVKNLVDGMSLLDSEKNSQPEYQKIISAGLGVWILKLADRLHNMRTLEAMPEIKQKVKSEETLKIYAKLAEALGMWRVKVELEDLAFMYFDPNAYGETKLLIDNDPRNSERFKEYIRSYVLIILRNAGVDANVFVQTNGIYKTGNKIPRAILKGIDPYNAIRDINDLISVRVTVSDIAWCYQALQVINSDLKLPQLVDQFRFDEYLTKSRSNGYSALQSTFDFPEGSVEIAITTIEKEKYNNNGVLEAIKDNDLSVNEFGIKTLFIDGEVIFSPKKASGYDLALQKFGELGAKVTEIIVEGVSYHPYVIIPNGVSVDFVFGDQSIDPTVRNLLHPTTKRMFTNALRNEERLKRIVSGREICQKVLNPRGFLSLEDIQSILSDTSIFESSLAFIIPPNCEYSIENIYHLIGAGVLNIENLDTALENCGISEVNKIYTTIYITGKNREGISSMVSTLVKNKGGDIKNEVTTVKDDTFTLKKIASGITKLDSCGLVDLSDENTLRSELASCELLNGCTVVVV